MEIKPIIKKATVILIDCALAVYLVLAVSAFNRPDALTNVCGEVKIDIQEDVVKGFLKADDVKTQLLRAKLYPLGDPIEQVKTRRIEEALLQNPFVETAQCYKTQTGRVCITLTQRNPVVRVKADNGDDFYIDSHGNMMPATRYISDLVIVTGHVSRQYAQKVLPSIGSYLLQNSLWRNQVEQLNVLADGSMELVPRVGSHIVYLGQPTDFAKKLDRLEKFYKYGLSKAGWNKYSYINIEFHNQIICKRTKQTSS